MVGVNQRSEELKVDLPVSGEMTLPLAPFRDARSERLAAETASRSERLRVLSEIVDKVFPAPEVSDIRAEIKETFSLPQFGKYHNEGVFMDSHLALILKTIEELRSGIIDPLVPEDVGEILRVTARSFHSELQRYTFLHDLEKPSCTTIVFKSGEKREVSTREAYAIVPVEDRADCQRAYAAIEEQEIEKISYHHEKGERVHGPVAAARLGPRQAELGLSEVFMRAIALHEIAYQFTSGRADTFRRYFSALSADEQACVLTASYIDLKGSLQPDGQSDLSPFIHLLRAMKNHQTIAYIETQKNLGALGGDIDQGKYQKYLAQLLKRDDVIADSLDEACRKAFQECRVSRYNRPLAVNKLSALVGDSISQKQCEGIIECFVGDGDIAILDSTRFSALRSTLGKANAAINKALQEAELR